MGALSVMWVHWFRLSLLSLLVLRCSSECYFDAKGVCEHDGRMYSIGDTWMKQDCYQCICLNPLGVGCCDNTLQPVDYPAWCEVIRRPDSCSLVVVMKANPRIPCGSTMPRPQRFQLRDQVTWQEPNETS
ncbi:prostate-associated microseminoprotein-like [Discoglossus pictus]